MRIIQMLPVIAFGDAIGNDTVTLKNTLKDAGYETEIYAEVIDGRLPEGTAYPVDTYEERKDDIILYHLSTGSDLNYKFEQYQCRKMIMYHNITPPHFFAGYNEEAEESCRKGLEAADFLSDKVEFCFADSDFNKQDLRAMGYECEIEVLPILIAFKDFEKKPNSSVIKKYSNDGYVNIVFTGRVAPNKKHEDLIASFYYYNKYINPKSRLFLVGAYGINDRYYQKLAKYVEMLKLKNVYFTGHIKFDEILAYYSIADVFLCLSEHEGFCVPLVEAMYFNVPVIAYDSCAVGDTLGGSGLLLTDKTPEMVAEAIHRVVSDDKLRENMIKNERERLAFFEHERIKNQFLGAIKKFAGGEIR